MDRKTSNDISIKGREITPPHFEPEFEVSWAGEDPFSHRYCLGSEDGRLLFVNPKTTKWSGPFDVAPSKEAVNGVAFGESSIVVSTRQDVVCVRTIEGVDHVAALPQGAHGVCVSRQGDYYAPVGRQGLLKLESAPERLSVGIFSPADQDIGAYFYRVACLSSPDRGEALACALRRGGFAVLPLSGPNPQNRPRFLRTGTDIVDVCPLGTDDSPLGAVGLGADCSIHVVQDVFIDKRVKTIRFGHKIQGRAYRILSAEGHLFLLTHRGLYTILDMASRIPEVSGDQFSASMHFLELEAVDMGLTSNGRLLVLMPEIVLEVEIESLVNRQDGPVQSRPSRTEETWEDVPDSWQWSRADQGVDPIGRWESSGQSLLCAL